MKRRASLGSIIGLQLDHAAPAPVYQQLYNQLRGAILSGRLVPRARLPSSRVLAEELRLSRNTVMGAYENLVTEGYIVMRVGPAPMCAIPCRKTASCPGLRRPCRCSRAICRPCPSAAAC